MALFGCARCEALESENTRLWEFVRALRSVTLAPMSLPDMEVRPSGPPHSPDPTPRQAPEQTSRRPLRHRHVVERDEE